MDAHTNPRPIPPTVKGKKIRTNKFSPSPDKKKTVIFTPYRKEATPKTNTNKPLTMFSALRIALSTYSGLI